MAPPELLQALAPLHSDSGRLLLWGLFPRGVSAVYLLCFASLLPQLLPFLGSRGYAPAALLMEAQRRDLPLLARLRLNPSLLWLAHSDRALVAWCALGMLGAAAGIYGGALAWPGTLIAWLTLLSFKRVGRMYYPWDNLLAESGFLCLFLPAIHPLPSLSAAALPGPLLAFAFPFTLFRVVFGFGKTKFPGFEWKDRLYTRHFLMNMPVCTRLGWRLSKAPGWIHMLTLVGVAVVELLFPFFILIPGPLRLVGVAGMVGQMIGIQLTGNFGYFNLLSAVYGLACLDLSANVLDAFVGMQLLRPDQLPFTLAFVYLFPAGLTYLIFNNWFSGGWLHWPSLDRLRPGPLKAWIRLLRALEPLNLTHAYGVFRSRPAPPVRWVTVVEGREGGGPWRPYRFPYTFTDASSPPRFIAPHHPRLDHMSFYDAVGVDGSGYFHVLSFDDPYRFTRASILERAGQRLLEPDSPVRRLFSEVPFDGRAPDATRVALYRFTATSRGELKATGRHYHVEPIGLHAPESQGDEHLFDDWLPRPEQWHVETRRWRQRAGDVAPVSPQALAAFEGLLTTLRALIEDVGGGACTWESLTPVVKALRQRCDEDALRAHALTFARLRAGLLAPLEAVFSRPASHFLRDVVGLGEPGPDPRRIPRGDDPEAWLQALAAWPHGPLRTGFHVALLAQALLFDRGSDAFVDLTGRPFTPGAPIPTRIALPPSARGSMAAAARCVGLSLPTLERECGRLELRRAFFLEAALHYDLVARTSSRLAVLYSSGDTYVPIPTGLLPGVFDLAWSLLDHGELPPLIGWGDGVKEGPTLRPPKMYLWEDGEYRPTPDPGGRPVALPGASQAQGG